MLKNHSPWLHQLNRTRPVSELNNSQEFDVAIVGGGIAGIATAFFLLRDTNKSVVLLESNKIAHGATGHNGGFLASYFERSFFSIAQEYGMKKASEAQSALNTSWDLLDEIREYAKIETPMWQFTGYAAVATHEELLIHLRNYELHRQAGLDVPKILIADDYAKMHDIPDNYHHLLELIPQVEISNKLETEVEEYFAILPERKGCMNSAVFTEEVANFLLSNFADRFTLAEHAPVRRLILKNGYNVLDLPKKQSLMAKQVILCTNGFESVKIINTVGKDIDTKFHQMVRGIVGYMAGYVEESNKPPTEINYLPKHYANSKDVFSDEPYFYITRRPFRTPHGNLDNLICIGGPESLMDDTNNYNFEHPYSEEARVEIDNFLRYTYKHSARENIEYKFMWHGLMGFTPNSIRLIGPEPINPSLFYNLGCNGVGLLPSIFGGKRISQFINQEKLSPSIFDPK